MAFSDELRKMQNPETNYDRLAYCWERELKSVAEDSGYRPESSDEKYHYDAVAGPIGVSLDYERRVNEVKVQGYNQRDLKRYSKLTNYNPGFIWRRWVDDDGEYIPLGNLSKYTKHFVKEDYKQDLVAGKVLGKYDIWIVDPNRCNGASLFSEEEEATKVARIIKSCDDGGFKRYKAGVRRISCPVCVEAFVTNVIPGRSAGIFVDARKEEYDVAFRTVGRQVKYAVEVDIAW